MKKRVLAMTLILTLLLGLLPGSALAVWDSFRGSPDNMAITQAATPTAENVQFKWAKALGSGYESPVSVPILTEDALICMAGTTLFKLDAATGEILAQAEMAASAKYANAAPAYAEGKLICALDGGVVQAFDAGTLASLWVYTDPLGGQNQVPVTYADGLIYTGFWSGETKTHNYVCLSVADEDPVQGDEAKAAKWVMPNLGGYYWAGAAVVGKAVIFGCDNGKTGTNAEDTGCVYSVDRDTGTILSVLPGIPGDQRSSMAWCAEKKRVYFTTKAGYLCSAAVDEATGALSDLKTAALGSQTTATPVVYGGRVYLTAANIGFGASAVKQNFQVADADTLEVLYTLPMLAYPQSSLLLSTAYLAGEGKLYFYSTYNAKPGGVTLIKIDPAATTAAGGEVVELYDAAGYEEYCICSLICGGDGTLYYKNDSGNILALGKKAGGANPGGTDERTMQVTVGAYDYNAVTAKLDGASESGVIFEETVRVPTTASADDAVRAAAKAAGQTVTIEDSSFGPYLTAINGLISGTGGGYSGWTMVYNGVFPSVGMGGLTLSDGDELAFHYSVNPDMNTDDVGSGEGLPMLSSFTLGGVTVELKKETAYDENWVATTSYLLRTDGGEWTALEGKGTKAEPFLLPVTLPAGTDVSALTADYTTQLGEQYHTVSGLEGQQDYTKAVTFALKAAYGGEETWYQVNAEAQSAGGTSSPSRRPSDSRGEETTAETAPKTFADVADSHWAGSAIAFVTAQGLFSGTSETTFSPEMTTTRGMVMTVLARLAGADTQGGETWYEKGMAWAKERGISDGTAPEAVVTREQLAAMLYRYAGAKAEQGEDGLSYADAGAVSSWAVEAMTWCVKEGILTGKPGNLLDPQGSATRAEVAAVLERFVSRTVQ